MTTQPCQNVTWAVTTVPMVITPEKIQELISDLFSMPWAEINQPHRAPDKVSARFLYAYFMKSKFGTSSVAIAKILDQNHTTVLNAFNCVQERLDSKDPKFDDFKHKYLKLDYIIHN
jgi:chromosomal replication initiation ATPase DnaA